MDQYSFIEEGALREEITGSEISSLRSVEVQTILLKALDARTPATWEQIVTKTGSTKDSEDYAGITEAPLPEEVPEGTEFPSDWDFATEKINIVNKKWGKILPFSAESFEDDKTGALKAIVDQWASMVVLHKNKTLFGALNTITTTTCYDAANIGSTTGHPAITGGAALTVNINAYSLGPLTEANLEAVEASIAGFTMRNGEAGDYPIKLLYCHPSEFRTAQRIMGSPVQTGATFGHVLNVHAKDNYLIVVSPHFTNGRWGIQTVVPGFIYQERGPLTVAQLVALTGRNFTHDTLAFRVRQRWGYKFIDWRNACQGN